MALLVLAAAFAASASAQTSVGLSLYGAFNQSTSGNNTAQSPSNSAGGLIELRHTSNPILGFEATYSYNRANQHYSYDGPPLSAACPTTGCSNLPASVKANANQQVPVVLYANQSTDITKAVIDAYNTKSGIPAPEHPAAASAPSACSGWACS